MRKGLPLFFPGRGVEEEAVGSKSLTEGSVAVDYSSLTSLPLRLLFLSPWKPVEASFTVVEEASLPVLVMHPEVIGVFCLGTPFLSPSNTHVL